MKKWIALVSIVMVALIISACSGNDNDDTTNDSQNHEQESNEDNADDLAQEDDENTEENDSTESKEVNVTLNDVDGNKVAEATLTDEDDGVNIKLIGEGFSENGEHAFHIHEKGICEPDDFESAGGHYNPTDKEHGKESEDGPHAGDFDNIEANEEGEVDVEFVTDQISLDEEAENTVFTEDGTSFVIHADPDDYKSQPSGDAGDRIACGVIAEPK